MEICEAIHKRKEFTKLIAELPSILIKTSSTIIREEIKTYPKPREEVFSLHLIENFIDEKLIEALLSYPELSKARQIQQTDAMLMEQYIQKLKPNYPTSKSGKYSIEQANDFVWYITCQWLLFSNPEFMIKLNERNEILDATHFKSLNLFGYVIFARAKEYGVNTNSRDKICLIENSYCARTVVSRDNELRVRSEI